MKLIFNHSFDYFIFSLKKKDVSKFINLSVKQRKRQKDDNQFRMQMSNS